MIVPGKGAPAAIVPPIKTPAQQAAAAAAQQGGSAQGKSPPIVVTACASNPTVSNIIKGSYTCTEANHGKPVYKKDIAGGTVSVLIYYWDERDGPNFSGWWFGPKIGGDQVWAYSGNKESPLPPPTGWQVPWDGPVDPSLKLSYGQVAAAPVAGKGMPAIVPATWKQDAAAPGAVPAWKQAQQAKEAEQAKRQEELKAKREEAEVKRKEQAAALAVRQAIQKVRTANPDSYDSLRTQLEEAQAANLEAMGSSAEKVSAEAQQALEQAQKRIDEMNEKRVADQKKKAEEEQKKKEEEEKVEKFLEKSKAESMAIQEKIKMFENIHSQFEDAEKLNAASPEETSASAEAEEKKLESLKEDAVSTRKAIIENQKEFGDSEAIRKVRRDIVELTTKLAQGIRGLEKQLSIIKSAREQVADRASALDEMKEKKAEFSKYDKDKDGKLNRKEADAYCKAVLDFALPKEIMDQLFKKLEPITYEKFRALHQKTFIAKSEILAREARAEEEARQKVVQEKTDAVKAILAEAEEAMKAAEQLASECETKARPLIKDSELPADEIKAEADAVDEMSAGIDGHMAKCAEKLKEAKEASEGTPELQGFDQKGAERLNARDSKVKSRMTKINAATKLAREKATRKSFAEMDQKRAEAVTAIRSKMTEDSKTAEQCFDGINGGSALSKDKFAEFVKGLPGLELAEGMVEKLFSHIAAEESEIDKEKFLTMVRLYYKVVKSTVLSAELAIKSKTVRRLELGEVLEALESPQKEDGAGVQRVKCRSVQDETVEGWVTLAGNQGTAFLEPGGNFYSCIKETLLTDGLSVVDSKTVRRILKGEVLEVLEWPKKDAGSETKRIKGKAKNDGAIGWITVSSGSGTLFLEPC